MTGDLALRRQFFAEEVQLQCNLRTPGLVDALATVPRERFLRPGPWVLRSDSDWAAPPVFGQGGPPRQTPDADPRHVYHNVAIAIDPARQLFNGQPGTLGVLIDALGLSVGARVLHVGCGLGYYTALMAHCVGSTGYVRALEVDNLLASEARSNLATFRWVDVRSEDATRPLDTKFDAILVNAGVTHPQETWLDNLDSRGRLVLPLTATVAAIPTTIGKGPVLLVSREPDGSLAARILTFVAIYSGIGLRDPALNDRLGEAMKRSGAFAAVKRLRRDAHDASPSCWFHGERFCFATQVQ